MRWRTSPTASARLNLKTSALYDWLLARLAEGGLINTPVPRQYEFARLNLTHVLTSKRKLKQLVDEKHVSGWGRSAHAHHRRFAQAWLHPEALQLFAERIGGANRQLDRPQHPEAALRDTLEPVAARAMAVLDPVDLYITNWAEVMGLDTHLEPVMPRAPHLPERGAALVLGQHVWIERSDYEDVPPKGYNRLYPPQLAADGSPSPGSRVRLKYGYVIECTGATKDARGQLLQVQARLVPDTKAARQAPAQSRSRRHHLGQCSRCCMRTGAAV